ncbi:MAG: hypothetical protein KJO10_09480, partial [Gammaproteobacteria bacterium]|nr:hypothetical protein [Gammaproteobacteria bacterium]
ALIDWASFCKLGRPDKDMAMGLFSVELHSDCPPAYRSLHGDDQQADNKNLRILDTTAVADRLRAALDNASRNQTGFGNKDTLQHLILAWGAMPKRRFPRQASTATLPVKLVVGLNTIHQMVSGPQTASDSQEETYMDHAWLQDPTFDRTTRVTVDPYQVEDVTTITINDVEQERQRGAYTAAEMAGPQVEFWKIADMSAAGYCLLWENATASSVQVGEVVAIINQEAQLQDTWQLGVTRWMKFEQEHGLGLGIQMLSPGARAVWAYVRNDDVGRHIAAINKMQGILLPGIEAIGQQDSLILPCLPFRTGCSAILEAGEETREIVLTRQLENTGRFAHYHYAIQDSEDV